MNAFPVILLLFQAAAIDPAQLLQQGRLREAEQALRARTTPGSRDVRSLMLLAVVLDQQNRYTEAEPLYHRAIQLEPKAAQLWNNFGNHCLARGNVQEARQAFERALAIDPSHTNAHLQLARLAVEQGRPAEALPHLEFLQAGQSQDPALLALYGRALAAHERFSDAERVFAAALERAPDDFGLRVNLGLAALNAGSLDRALQIFEAAYGQQPSDPDVLYGLARAYFQRGQIDRSLSILADARRVAPQRADIIALLARAASTSGFYADAAEAWGEYLKLEPSSPLALRERAFTLVLSGDQERGLPELESVVRQQRGDAVSHFELGVAYGGTDKTKAINQFTQALRLNPRFSEALYARGTLLAVMGKLPEAVADLERAVTLNPENAKALGRLGQTYQSLGRDGDAERVLRRAVTLDPNDGAILIHLASVLRQLGRQEESRQYLNRFRALGGAQKTITRRGLLEFLSLAPEQRTERYIENLRAASKQQPSREDLRLKLGLLLLDAGKAEDAQATFKELRSTQHVQEATKALLEAGCYRAVVELLGQAGVPSLNFAIATYHLSGPQAGLKTLEQIPPAQRDGDYWLAQAQMLDAAGQLESAVAALNRGFAAAPTRADLYHEATMLLLRRRRVNEALSLLDQAIRQLPDDRSLQLDRAIALELAQRFEESRQLLATLERRWPEWPRPWVVHGISFMSRSKATEALPLLENASAAGDNTPELHYYLAEALAETSPANRERARQEVVRALELTADDPYALALLGRLEVDAGSYEEALKPLARSAELLPDLVQAHYQLMRAYSALGRKEQAVEQSRIVAKLRAEGRDAAEQNAVTREISSRIGQ